MVDSTSFFSASSDVTTDATLITSAIDADFNQADLSATPAEVLNLTSNTVNGLFYKNGVGICQKTNSIRQSYNSGLQKCREFVSATSSISSNTILSADLLANELGNIPVYSMDIVSG